MNGTIHTRKGQRAGTRVLAAFLLATLGFLVPGCRPGGEECLGPDTRGEGRLSCVEEPATRVWIDDVEQSVTDLAVLVEAPEDGSSCVPGESRAVCGVTVLVYFPYSERFASLAILGPGVSGEDVMMDGSPEGGHAPPFPGGMLALSEGQPNDAVSFTTCAPGGGGAYRLDVVSRERVAGTAVFTVVKIAGATCAAAPDGETHAIVVEFDAVPSVS